MNNLPGVSRAFFILAVAFSFRSIVTACIQFAPLCFVFLFRHLLLLFRKVLYLVLLMWVVFFFSAILFPSFLLILCLFVFFANLA